MLAQPPRRVGLLRATESMHMARAAHTATPLPTGDVLIVGGDITVGTIWLLIATALVIFMTPGLAFFYGGLVKAKSVVSMAMLSFGAMGIVSVLWVLYGFNIGFIAGDKTDLIPGVLAHPTNNGIGLSKVFEDPTYTAFVAFGASFAIITVALISGAIVP